MNAFRWIWLFLKFVLLAFLSVPFNIFAKLICWILPFFVEEETKRLPKWLDWFMTPNSSADGDPAHQKRWPGTDKWSTYKRRTAWFWRNSAYGFDRQVCGVDVYASDFLKVYGNPKANRRPFIAGTCLRLLYSEQGHAKSWFLYFCWSWPFGLLKTRCIRGSIGWKLWMKDGNDRGFGVAMWTGMVNPLFHKE